MSHTRKNPTTEAIKNVASTILLLWSCSLVGGLIVSGQTKIAKDVHPALAAVLLIFAVCWLSVVEGGQASLVGLAPVHRDLYKETHPTAYKCTAIAHTGDNLDRYLLGRQFIVVLIVFTINQSGYPISGSSLWGLPPVVLGIFLRSELSMILMTTMAGQLNSQVNASSCMLDYLNTKANYVTIFIARLIEASGLVHASYLIKIFVAGMAHERIESREPPRTELQNIFFYGRCFMSLGIVIFSLILTLTALFNGKTNMWDGVPNGIAVIVFFLLIALVGMLEGMQIAFFAVSRIPEDERGDCYFAKKTCQILFLDQGRNLAGFLIGRQLCVVSCMFFIARVTSLNIDPHSGETIFGVSPGTQVFFNLGFLGAVMTTIFASIAWQLFASAFPIAFLNNPLTLILLRWCLFLESTGICNGAYVIAWIHKKIAGFQPDEVYIGTAEERRAKNMGDDASALSFGAGHIAKLPFTGTTNELKHTLSSRTTLNDYVASVQLDEVSNTSQEPEV